MTLRDQLNADLRDAMRAGDETRKTTLRLLITAIRNAEIPPEGSTAGTSRSELDDDGVLSVVRREVKQRRDSIEAYAKANRQDLVDKEEAELGVLSTYLPAQMSREQIETVAKAIIERLGAGGPADKGKVMPAIMAELRDKAEGREINAVVTELLNQG
ncbi:MAG TPA: GatB/YqeY domain-containing protein [Dehalococcoidia bacterium]|nr:GatB/YqeY domain-containing protein [Dehalococcoidia bacterium]